jgi:hypothetical protein
MMEQTIHFCHTGPVPRVSDFLPLQLVKSRVKSCFHAGLFFASQGYLRKGCWKSQTEEHLVSRSHDQMHHHAVKTEMLSSPSTFDKGEENQLSCSWYLGVIWTKPDK